MRLGGLFGRFLGASHPIFVKLAIACIAMLFMTPASADRFLERLVPADVSVPNGERSQVVTFYRSVAFVARRQNNAYLADHFARRAAHFLYYAQQVKAPIFFFDAMREQASTALLNELSKNIDVALDCAPSQVALKDKLKLIEGFEELSLKALQSDGRNVYAPRVKRLSLTATMMPKVEGCTPLGPVPLPERELDWNLTNAAEEMIATPAAAVKKVDDIRPVFGRVLDGPGSRSGICNVYFSQRTIYFDIGSYKINTASADQELKAVEDNLVKYPDSTVVVEAHADDPGGRNINLELGARRASSVAQYLSRVIGTPRFQLVSLGANCPQRQGLGKIHVRENRRATIKIMPITRLNQ